MSNASVDVVSDIVSLVDAFRGLPDAPSKARADLANADPARLGAVDGVISIFDALHALGAFRGFGYPVTLATDPCP